MAVPLRIREVWSSEQEERAKDGSTEHQKLLQETSQTHWTRRRSQNAEKPQQEKRKPHQTIPRSTGPRPGQTHLRDIRRRSIQQPWRPHVRLCLSPPNCPPGSSFIHNRSEHVACRRGGHFLLKSHAQDPHKRAFSCGFGCASPPRTGPGRAASCLPYLRFSIQV